MRRAFDLEVLRCPRCAGRMELIATIDDPAVIHRILAHLALPGHGTTPSPRPLCLLRETTSPRSPSRSRCDVAGPPARAVVCPEPPARHGVCGFRPAGRCRLTTPTDSGRIARSMAGALSAPYHRGNTSGGTHRRRLRRALCHLRSHQLRVSRTRGADNGCRRESDERGAYIHRHITMLVGVK